MPTGATRGLVHARKTGWQLAKRAWEESGLAWEDQDEFLADPSPTRHDLPVVPAQDEFYAGMGPWPVRVPSGEPPAAPAVRVPASGRAGGEDREAPPLPRRIRRASTAWEDAPRDAAGSAFAPASPFAPSPAFGPRPPYVDRPARAERQPADPLAAVGGYPAFGAPVAPLGAPVAPLGAPVAPLSAPAAPLGAPVVAPRAEQEELFRAWQGSVNKAAGRRTTWTVRRPSVAQGRRNRGWQAAKIVVPAVVIVTVGAGALMMLTGRANEMLAERASSGALSSGKPASGPVVSGQTSAGPASAAPAGGAGLTLAGYPAEHGTLEVAALWSAGGTTVAVGAADGHPAAWRHAAGGTWSLVSTALLGGVGGHLTSVAQGPSGWIAVGSVNENGTAEPAVFGSADGAAWQQLTALTALAGDGAQFLGLAAGPEGYLVVGKQGTGGQTSVALWWSNDLRDWVSGENNGPPGSLATAAAATADGFVAVGSEGGYHTLWTSADGQHWTAHDLAVPSGATAATLTSVAAGQDGQSDRFVAAGTATTSAGDLPLVVTAANDGTHISQTVLSSPDGPATVTAVTATADGFVAVGAAGLANAQRPVTWTSVEGRIWTSPAALTAAGASEITALTATGNGTTITATASRGATPAVLTLPAP